MWNVLDVFSIAGIAIGVFSALRILKQPVDKGCPDHLLCCILVLCVANIIHSFLTMHLRTSAGQIFEPLQFILPLALVWYVRSLQGKRFFVANDSLIIALPLFFILTSNFSHVSAFILPSQIPVFSLVMWLTMAATSMLLLIPLASEINNYRKSLQQEYSNLQGIDANWLKSLLILMGILFGIYALLAILMIHAPEGFPQKKLLAALMSGVTIYLSWKTYERKPRIVNTPPDINNESDIIDPQLLIFGNQIKKRIESDKLYLDPELSLDDLARITCYTRHQVSSILNQGLNVTFFDLINGYRVEEFQRLCRNPEMNDEKILTLAFNSGFNSKPSFNLAFKRLTGETPSQSRQPAKIESLPNA